jgi:putative ABC transport system permease protein
VDRSLYVPLEGIESIHEAGLRGDGERKAGLSRPEISAAFLRLKSKFGILQLQREINEYRNEPLTGILPGLTLMELWKMIGVVENALLTISLLAFIISLIGMVLVFLSGLNERRREMAILRSVGARPIFVFSLFVIEAGLLAILGAVTGFLLLNGFLFAAQPFLQDQLGLQIMLFRPSLYELIFLALVLAGAFFAALIPAIQAYRTTLSDGLTIHI